MEWTRFQPCEACGSAARLSARLEADPAQEAALVWVGYDPCECGPSWARVGCWVAVHADGRTSLTVSGLLARSSRLETVRFLSRKAQEAGFGFLARLVRLAADREANAA